MVHVLVNEPGLFYHSMNTPNDDIKKSQEEHILWKLHGESAEIDGNYVSKLEVVKSPISAGQQLRHRKIGNHANGHERKIDWENLCYLHHDIVFNGHQQCRGHNCTA